MKGLIAALLLIISGGLLVLEIYFGAVMPCGILRAKIRQEAAREGGAGLIASIMPDAVIDALLVAQFGPLSQGRCLQLAFSGAPTGPQPQSRSTLEQAAERQERIMAMQFANLRSLIERMSVFTIKADEMLPKFSSVEKRYQYITERMRGAPVRERSIYVGIQTQAVRSQISVAITQASIEANQVHISVQSSYRDFFSTSGQLGSEFVSVGQSCHAAHVATGTAPVPAGLADWNAACLHFFDVARQFQQRVSDLRGAFSQVENVWQIEHRQQDEIVQASIDAEHLARGAVP